MNNNRPYYEQIEAFLSGYLAPDQRAAMEKALLEDSELAREVELRRLEFDVSEALIAQNIRDQLVRLRTSPSPETQPPAIQPYKFRPLLWLIAALLSIAAIGIYWWNQQAIPIIEKVPSSAPQQTPPVLENTVPIQPQEEKPPTQPAQKNTSKKSKNESAQPLALATTLYQRPDLETLRGTVPMTNDVYQVALSAWEKQDYVAVVATLQNVTTNDPKWLRAATLLAHAQFNLKYFAQAAQGFSAIADRKIRPWSEEAEWYVLLALLADGKAGTTNFRTRLEQVLADEGHPYFEETRELKANLAKH